VVGQFRAPLALGHSSLVLPGSGSSAGLVVSSSAGFQWAPPGVATLVNLSRYGNAHIRRVADWSGTTSYWRLAVSSLTHHLVCKYEVPVFLASSWYSAEEATADEKRGWFVAHARGASFRSLNLPIVMTRKMKKLFLASQDHLAMEHAMRRAELLALGAPAEFVQAVLSSDWRQT
jgi:hypothetical protein